MTTDFRALCAELLAELENAIRVIYREDGTRHIRSADPVITKADIALAQPAQPEEGMLTDEELGSIAAARARRTASEPPADGEVGELVKELRRICFDVAPCDDDIITRAAELLEQRHPAPVPVSERLPGPGDCDAEGRCWWLAPETAQKCAVWCFGPKYPPSMFGATHWLPAHALPLPAGEVE